MIARLRMAAVLAALVAAMVAVLQAPPPEQTASPQVALRSTDEPAPSPVVELTDPSPFDPCRDIPVDVTNGLGLGFTPPEDEGGLRCHYDAGHYQMAVQAYTWRAYENSLPPEAAELDIAGHRAAQYWVMKPTDWNDRWWISCMITFKTSYGVIQQSLFYSPIYSPNAPECMSENMMRAHQLVPHYKF